MALPPHLAELESRLSSRFDEAIAKYRRALEEQIRRDSEARFAALSEVPAPSVADWFPESQLAELDLAPKQTVARDAFARLADAVRRLDGAQGQAEALDALLDGALPWADRVAMILARDLGLTGWGDRGFEGESLAGRELAWNTTLRERLLASRGCLRLDSGVAREVLSEFGCGALGAAVVVPLVLRDRIAALLWADCGEGEPELAPLQILVHAAGQRLELQALTDRAFSPTLWEGADAPGEPLPLWTVLAPAALEEPAAAEPEAEAPPMAPAEPEPVVEPEAEPAIEPEPPTPEPASDGVAEPQAATPEPPSIEAEGEEAGAELWQAEEDAGVAEPVAEAPSSVLVEETPAEEISPVSYTDYAEPADLTGEVAPPEAAPGGEPAAEPQPEFELESVEPTAEEMAEADRWEPEPVAEEAPEVLGAATEPGLSVSAPSIAEPIATGPPAVTEPEPVELAAESAADGLGTVRMELPVVEPPAHPAEETATPTLAPEPVEAPPSTAGTQEVAASPETAEESPADTSEDATLLSVRRPPMPEAAPPAAAAEPPTWSATPAAPADAPPEVPPMERTGSRFARSTEVSPPPDVSGPGLAFLSGRSARAAADPAHEEAKRLARLLVSEIRLYNEELVLEGRRHRDLYHRLREDIDRSRQIYDERVDAAVRSEVDYFQQELVRSLAGGDPRALGI